MASEDQKNREQLELRKSLAKIQYTEYEEENRPYFEILLDQLQETADQTGWQWSSGGKGEVVLQHAKHMITFKLDPLDDTFAGAVLTTMLDHDLDVFNAMRQLGRKTE